MDYSQFGEQEIIRNYFGSKVGTFLDLGANDGKTLSNVYDCVLRRWAGTCVEPSKIPFNKLLELHKNNDVECFNIGISDKEGLVEFHDSGTHLNKGDTSLLSTFVQNDYDKWKGSTEFTTTTAQLITFKQLMVLSKIKTFDLISIDIEGLDFQVLTQMNLTKLKCQMLIVETNSVEDQKYIDYVTSFGMKLIHKNYCNLIFVR